MKKQKFEKKLNLNVRKISSLSMLSEIIGGRTVTCNLLTDAKDCLQLLTEAHRCTHTIGNGLDIDGNPCAF